jgi:SpoIIAA-like
MIQVLENFPDQVVGFLCSGPVTRGEYERVLIPGVRKAFKTHQSVRLYYETTADFRLSLPAAWQDLKLGIQHLPHWERIAVVTDIDWIVHAIHAFGFLFPRRVKVFPTSEAALARAWIVAELSETAKMTNI